MKSRVYKKMPSKIQRSLRKFLPKLLKSQVGHVNDWFEKLQTKLHVRGIDYLLRVSPLSAMTITNNYGAGNLSASLHLESDRSIYPPASLQGPDLAT